MKTVMRIANSDHDEANVDVGDGDHGQKTVVIAAP